MRRAAVVLALLLAAAPAAAGPYEDARRLHDQGNRTLEAGNDDQDLVKVRAGLASLEAARALYRAALADPALPAAERANARTGLLDVESKLDWWASLFPAAAGPAPTKRPEVKLPEPGKGEPLAAWCGKVRAQYLATADPEARAAIADRMAAKAGAFAVPTLLSLFAAETEPKARAGVRDGLVLVGGPEVARAMAAYARDDRRRDDALDVVYRALERPEAQEPERPWCRAIRTFHEAKVRPVSLAVLTRLDAMGYEGVAALGEVLYVDDFGYHDHASALLGRKRDRRAVPPLVFKLNRFAFDARDQLPAHQALLAIGWFAVPELIDHLDDAAAGTWVSWTLRKITGETMGTDRRKWTEWWKLEGPKHPELSADPAARPPGAAAPLTPGSGTTPSK